MKFLLEEKVYDIPLEALMAWIRMTPELNTRVEKLWTNHRRTFFEDFHVLTGPELEMLIKTLPAADDEYMKVQLDAILDMRETMKEDFEDWLTDMTADELVDYAEQGGFRSYEPSEPVKIPVTNTDEE